MEIELFNNRLKVFEDGRVLVKKNGEFVERKLRLRNGYNHLHLHFKGKRKCYKVHRLVAHVYLGLDIENPKQMIDHIDRNKLNNNVSNLRIVTNQQNQFNKNAKGYYWAKGKQKYQSEIMLNNKTINLGLFEKEEDARQAYLNAKEIHHTFLRNPILRDTLPPDCNLNGTSSPLRNL